MDIITWHVRGGWDRPNESGRTESRVPFCYAYARREDAVRAALHWLCEQDLAAVMVGGQGHFPGLYGLDIGDTNEARKDGRLRLRVVGPLRWRYDSDGVVVTADVEAQILRFDETTTTREVDSATVTVTERRPVVVVPWTRTPPRQFGSAALIGMMRVNIVSETMHLPPEHGRRAFSVRWHQLTEPDLTEYPVRRVKPVPAEDGWPAHWHCWVYLEAPNRDAAMAVAAARVRSEDVSEWVFRGLGWFQCDEIAWGRYEAALGAAPGGGHEA